MTDPEGAARPADCSRPAGEETHDARDAEAARETRERIYDRDGMAINPFDLKTVDEALTYVTSELSEALNCCDPPTAGRRVDAFHAGCCVLRAWATLTSSHFARLKEHLANDADSLALRQQVTALQQERDALKEKTI